MKNAPDNFAEVSARDMEHLGRAVALALEAERRGDLPVGAAITLDDEVIAGAGNAVLVPVYHPGRHAETETLRLVPPALWSRAHEMTCYTTLEPCVMCMGAMLLHGIGRIVFGARDREGGAGVVLPFLPRYYANGAGVPALVGPAAPELCDPLYRRVKARFDALPCGKNRFSNRD